MTRTSLLAAAVCGLLVAGCAGEPPVPAATPAPAPGDHTLVLDAGGRERTVLVHAPPGYTGDRPVPLVVALHFYPGSGQALREMIALDAKADEHGFLVAYPDGTGGGFNALVCCGGEDDVGFVRALTSRLISDWRADPARVYDTGISNGGDMSLRLAVEAADVFAAVGVVSGGFGGPRVQPSGYRPDRPVSVLSIIGSQDQYADTFRTGLDLWRERLGCTAVPIPAPAAGVRHSGARCADGSDVETYEVADMGHSWPGAPGGRMADPDAPIVATDLLWDFFADHPKRG